VQQLEELMNDQAAFKALLKEAVKGSPVSGLVTQLSSRVQPPHLDSTQLVCRQCRIAAEVVLVEYWLHPVVYRLQSNI
jgi:hypothetical protein